MGGGPVYSAASTRLLVDDAITNGYDPSASIFTRDADIRAGREKMKVHDDLDPLKMKRGIRECRDGDGKASRAVSVCLDITGSMSDVPKLILSKIPSLIGTIVKNGALEHPGVGFFAIGDAYSDQVPVQIGQFEIGNALDDGLSKVFLEGNGGGNGHESYDLYFYWLARHTETDCFEKRGEKGYAFLIQDEPPPPYLPKEHVKKLFGVDIEADIPLKTIIEEAKEKWEIFILRPQNLSMGKNAGITKMWEALFPDRVYPIQSPDGICEMIAMLIGAEEGVDLDAMVDTVSSLGGDKSLAIVAKDTVKSKGGGLAKKGSFDGDVDFGSGGASRL